ERSEIVISVRIVWLCGDDLLEGLCCLIEKTVLKESHAIGESVPLKCVLMESASERKRCAGAIRQSLGSRCLILQQLVRRKSLFNGLHEYPGLIDQKGSWQ